MKFVLRTNEIRLRWMKSGLRPGEIALLGRLWCPFGTNGIFQGCCKKLQHPISYSR